VLELYFVHWVAYEAHPVQAQGLELFNALGRCMQQAVLTNIKDVLITLNLMIQVAPSSMWADGMHQSGLFKWLLKLVISDKVGTRGAMNDVPIDTVCICIHRATRTF
jgi:hypothetical protein